MVLGVKKLVLDLWTTKMNSLTKAWQLHSLSKEHVADTENALSQIKLIISNVATIHIVAALKWGNNVLAIITVVGIPTHLLVVHAWSLALVQMERQAHF